MDPVSVSEFLYKLNMACDNNGAHQGRAMGFVLLFMKRMLSAAFITRLSLQARLWHGCVKEGIFSSCVRIGNHVFEPFGVDDIIGEQIMELYDSLPRDMWS